MKRKLTALVICVCLLAIITPSSSAVQQPPLSLISVDDLLPAELINTMTYYGSTIYVPYWLFVVYGLGISYSYSAATSTACTSNGADKQLYFDLAAGKTYDNDAYQYSIPAIMRGGTVYLPLSFMCGFFGGFSYSNIGSNEYGNILRIRTGREALTDEEFFRLAKPAMERYYVSYYQKQGTESTVTPTPAPNTDHNVKETQAHEGDWVLLGLEGIPTPDVMELIDRLGMKACFFLTEEEIVSNSDFVRRLSCQGFSIGVACSTCKAEEFQSTSSLLWEVTRVVPTMVLFPMECQEIQLGAKSVFPTIERSDTEQEPLADVYAITSELEHSNGDTTVIFPCREENETALRMLLYYLRDQGFSVRALRETD